MLMVETCILKDGGTSVAEIDLIGGNLILSCLTSDEDILFKGNDGGSTIRCPHP